MGQPAKTVLLVDDDKAILRTFSRILQKAGYKTETAENSKEALDKIRTRCYDVALIDVVLGDSNGIDLLPRIKDNSCETVKIMISGSESAERRVQAFAYGADAFLTKPVDPEALLAVFQKKLGTR